MHPYSAFFWLCRAGCTLAVCNTLGMKGRILRLRRPQRMSQRDPEGAARWLLSALAQIDFRAMIPLLPPLVEFMDELVPL